MGAADRIGAFGGWFALLWAAHDVADHVLQTEHQAARKAESWPAMAGHVGSYTAVQVGAIAALSGLTGTRPTWPRAVGAVAFSALSHAVLDRRWPVRWILEHTRHDGYARPPMIGPLRVVVPVETSSRFTGRGHTVAEPMPMHGPYLADQALHHVALAVCAALLAGGRRG